MTLLSAILSNILRKENKKKKYKFFNNILLPTKHKYGNICQK